MNMANRTSSSNTIGLILLSAGILSFEITLTRLFAIQQFHHFAFVVISLAVIGFAASGVLLSTNRKPPPLSILAVAYAIAIVIAYFTLNTIPFDSYSIGFQRVQFGILILYFATSGTPFLFAGWAIGATLVEAKLDAHKPYAVTFLGSALGCLLAIVAISTLGTEGSLGLSTSLGFLAAVFYSDRGKRILFSALFALTVLGAIFAGSSAPLHLSAYKPLSITKLAPDAEQTLQSESVASRLDIVETGSVHIFPGLSLNASGIIPLQTGIFIDGNGPIPITRLAPSEAYAQELVEHLPSSLALILRDAPRVLLLDPGAGLEAIPALASGARSVTLARDEPLIMDLLKKEYLDFSQSLVDDPRILLSDRGSRGTLESLEADYDIITYALTDSFRPVTSGAFSLTENFLLTKEAVTQAFDRLTSDGLLVITRWLGTPPSESARAWATLIAALSDSKIEQPSLHLIAFRGMRTATMIASRTPFSANELQMIRDFLEANAFDPIHLPDLDPRELNRFNRLPQDTYYDLFKGLLKNSEETISDYAFNLRPATDDRPFYYHFFRWRQTPDVIAELGIRWQPFGGSGYLVLFILLLLILLLALPLAIVPYFLRRKQSQIAMRSPKFPLYFIFLGAGYLLVEIPLIQKLTLLLDRPAIAFTVVLFSLLSFSGLGSLFVRRFPLRRSLIVLASYLFLLSFILPIIIKIALPWSLMVRILLTIVILAPAGLLMGIPFVTGIHLLEKNLPGFIPWAWAINGAASGVIGVLAAIFTLEFGLGATLIMGASAYVGAILSIPGYPILGTNAS